MVKQFKFARGVTLIEAMVAMSAMAIIAMGAISSQYHSARHSRTSRLQIVATRTAQLLLEDWKSTGGDENYDPTDLGLGFSSLSPIPSELTYYSNTAGTPLNDAIYKITVDGLPMLVMLKWRDIADPYGISEICLRELTVIVSLDKTVTEDAANLSLKSGPNNLRPVIMATYARVDDL